MSIDRVKRADQPNGWQMLQALVRADGTASTDYAPHLSADLAMIRDLADAAHFLCLLHARHPGTYDLTLEHVSDPVTRGWLEDAAATFSDERARIVAIVAAAGPLPSTPGQAQAENAIASQRHALDMLASSDRRGCAVGAALALALDWPAIQSVLDAAAARLGLDPVVRPETDTDAIRAVLDVFANDDPGMRALRFGAEQLLAQHRGLWSLLESRAHARKS